ncbi:NAD(P)H-dependent glycerol-3-phosphate dehydrogenase [Alphaproteobacteria bacterium]|nr:NAD(P)H-dependent glycerol-3-phosphate dehydrogenase [Alphaproteobacteria bacterium]
MSLYSNICFYGGGAWGQALAISLASIGYSSTLIVSDKNREQEINNHISKKFPEIRLSPLISASVKNREKLSQSDIIFITTESKRVIEVITEISLSNNKANVVITSKGFANNTGELFNETIQKQFPSIIISVLTGPTFADEIAKNQPAAAIVASKELTHAQSICQLFHNSNLRLYPSDDTKGASIAGAVKNIIAIGAGIIQGLGLGDNAKAALITRGISETSSLIEKLGGNPKTAFGLAGIGDMSLTCSGPHSRNMAYGMQITKDINADPQDLVEGLNAIEAAINLSKKLNLELPIIFAINKIIKRETSIEETIKQLFSRPISNEFK